jgi:hypothetical protein
MAGSASASSTVAAIQGKSRNIGLGEAVTAGGSGSTRASSISRRASTMSASRHLRSRSSMALLTDYARALKCAHSEVVSLAGARKQPRPRPGPMGVFCTHTDRVFPPWCVPNSVHTEGVGPNAQAAAGGNPGPVL